MSDNSERNTQEMSVLDHARIRDEDMQNYCTIIWTCILSKISFFLLYEMDISKLSRMRD